MTPRTGNRLALGKFIVLNLNAKVMLLMVMQAMAGSSFYRRAALLLPLILILRNIYRRWRQFPWGIRAVPRHWLLGNLLEAGMAIKNNQHLDWWLSLHKTYGDTLVVQFPFQPPLVDTVDPKIVEHILKLRFDNYIKGDWFRNRLTDLLGQGIFNVDGSAWYNQRKTASVMFSHNQFKRHIWRVVQKNCDKLVHILHSHVAGETIDIFNLMNRFTLDTIGEIGFSKTVGSLEQADTPFMKSFDVAQQVSVLRFVYPLWQLQRFFNVGNERGAKRHFKVLDEYSTAVVRDLREHMHSEGSDSFIGLFMKDAAQKGDTYNEGFMKDMVLNFLLAGRDTTAQALSWCLYLLMQHRPVEQRILDELNVVCGNRDVAYDDLNNLTYLQAVINETLRLYPSVPSDSKVAISDDILPDGTFLPRGCVVQFNPYCMGRSQRLWGEDADKFRPERWLGRDAPSPYEYPVFNAGPRECLGKRLASVEMKAALCCILKSVRLTLAVPPEAIRHDFQLTIGMVSGLPCTVEAR